MCLCSIHTQVIRYANTYRILCVLVSIQAVLDEALGLKNQIKILKASVDKQRKVISQVEEERDHYFNEATEQARKVESLLNEVRNEEGINFSFRKEMSDMESQLKQQ